MNMKGEIKVGDKVFPIIDWKLEFVPECSHPELTMELSVGLDRVFYCPMCKKKIEIPALTEATMKQSDMYGIVGIAFGERWKRYLEEMEKEQ